MMTENREFYAYMTIAGELKRLSVWAPNKREARIKAEALAQANKTKLYRLDER